LIGCFFLYFSKIFVDISFSGQVPPTYSQHLVLIRKKRKEEGGGERGGGRGERRGEGGEREEREGERGEEGRERERGEREIITHGSMDTGRGITVIPVSERGMVDLAVGL
jgi:hypothetical protein